MLFLESTNKIISEILSQYAQQENTCKDLREITFDEFGDIRYCLQISNQSSTTTPSSELKDDDAQRNTSFLIALSIFIPAYHKLVEYGLPTYWKSCEKFTDLIFLESPLPTYSLTAQYIWSSANTIPLPLTIVQQFSGLRYHILTFPFIRAFDFTEKFNPLKSGGGGGGSHLPRTASTNLSPSGASPPGGGPFGSGGGVDILTKTTSEHKDLKLMQKLDLMVIPLNADQSGKDTEKLYIHAYEDRVVVTYRLIMVDPTDKIYFRLFLQGLVDARKLPRLQNAPPLSYSAKLPDDIKNALNKSNHPNDETISADKNCVGYITMVIFPRHLFGNKRDSLLAHLDGFPTYLRYHVATSKAFLHTKMRSKAKALLGMLDRIKLEAAN